MALTNKISKLVGNYALLSFPVLGVLKVRSGINLLINDTFYDTFLIDYPIDMHYDIVSNQLKFLKDDKLIHHKGNVYQVDEFDISNDVHYFFYSLTKESVNHSFLWLKHDLLNVINPIMGFSDVLDESDEIPEDDLVLIRKIKSNAEKLYDQIQKLALLQSLESKNKLLSGTYEIEDFIKELSNQLSANQLDIVNRTKISHSGKVSDRIIQSDFRNTLEEHIKYMSSFQKTHNIEILSQYNNRNFIVKIFLQNCEPPSTYLDRIQDVDLFITKCEPINNLQTNTLNYLILSEICNTIGATIQQLKHDKHIIIQLNIPSLSDEKEIKPNINGIDKKHITKEKTNLFKEMPEDLFTQMKSICINFDGLLILDEWQKVCDQLLHLNKKHKNPELKNLIKTIQSAIQSFDVEVLRNTYNQCHHLFKNN